MKNSILTFTVIILSACSRFGVTESKSLVASPDPKFSKLVFSRDLRPIDGALIEIIVENNALGKYDANLIKKYADQAGSKRQSKKLAPNLECSFSEEPSILARVDEKPIDRLTKIICVSDQRPVHGELKELTFKKVSGSMFSASLRTAYFDRSAGKPVDTTELLESALMLSGTVPPTFITPEPEENGEQWHFRRDLRAVEGPLVEIALIKSSANTYYATVSKAYISPSGNHQERDNILAEDLECIFSKNTAGKLAKVSCLVDHRPVDGELRELTIELQSDSSYNTSLRIASRSIISGEIFDQTEQIATGLTMN